MQVGLGGGSHYRTRHPGSVILGNLLNGTKWDQLYGDLGR